MDTFLEHLLAESLNGRVVPKFELPNDACLRRVHEQLDAICLATNRYRLVPVTGNDGER